MLPVFQYFTVKLKCKADCDLKDIYDNNLIVRLYWEKNIICQVFFFKFYLC